MTPPLRRIVAEACAVLDLLDHQDKPAMGTIQSLCSGWRRTDPLNEFLQRNLW
jgi:hypothetical protein